MAFIAVADLETRGAADWAAEDWGAICLKLSGIFYTLIVKIYFDICNVCKGMDL